MLMGVLLRSRSYSLTKYVMVGMITGGIALFFYNPSHGARHDHSSAGPLDPADAAFGYVLLLTSLLLDGVLLASAVPFCSYADLSPCCFWFSA